MKVIVVANHIGGGGKTTVTAHLAVEAERSGAGPVVIMDLDSKGDLAAWWNDRKAETPLFTAPPPGGLAQSLRALEKQGIQLVFIDTPPGVSTASAAVLAVADLLLIPAQPSPNDLRGIATTFWLVKEAHKPMVFVINLVKSVKLAGEMAEMLSQFGTVAITMIWNRILYITSIIDGRTAPELDPTGLAAREVAKLWTDVNLRLHERPFKNPPPLSMMSKEFALLVSKGEAIASQNTALLPPAPSAEPSPLPEPPRSPPVVRTLRPRPAATSFVPKVQVSLHLTEERYEQLRCHAFEMREPKKAIIEEALSRFMDYLDEE